MTTTPAPTDHDTLRALIDAASPGPWAHEYEGSYIVHGDGHTIAEAGYVAADAAFIAAARNALPALLDELATTRAEVEKLTTALDIVALREIRQAADLAIVERERDRLRDSVQRGRQENAALRAELGNAKARIGAAATVEVWTNEDGKRFVFADDLMRALDPNPEANPATTAEPAAKADIIAEPPTQHFVDDADLALLAATATTAEPADEDELVPHVEHVSAATIAGMAAMSHVRNPEVFAPWDDAEPADEPKATVSRLDADKPWPTAYVPIVDESQHESVARITRPKPDAEPAAS